MRFAATATGAGVPAEDFAGTVAQVYPRVCLLALSDQSLMTLAASTIGHLPRGITLDSSPEFLLHGHVETGAEFALRGGILRFSRNALSVDLRGARRWRCDLAALRLDINRARVVKAWQAASAASCRDGRSNGLQETAGAAIEALTAATQDLAAAAAGEAVSALVGLGEGTTPAGDDFLVGYLAGLLCSAGVVAPRKNFAAALCAEVKAAATRTHRVSRLYLEAAAEGQISERLHALAACIAAGAAAETAALATQAALTVGHSSGACGVFGLLTGCAAWSQTRVARGLRPARPAA